MTFSVTLGTRSLVGDCKREEVCIDSLLQFRSNVKDFRDHYDVLYTSICLGLGAVMFAFPVQSISLCSNLLVGVGPCLRTCDSTEGMQLNMPLGTYNVFVSANVLILLDISHVQRIFME